MLLSIVLQANGLCYQDSLHNKSIYPILQIRYGGILAALGWSSNGENMFLLKETAVSLHHLLLGTGLETPALYPIPMQGQAATNSRQRALQ